MSAIAALHPWWPHLFTWPRFLDPVSWLWLSMRGYAFTSSGEQVSIPVGLFLLYRHNQCAAPWCPRLGKHPTADGLHKLCRPHHPDIDHKLSLEEIHDRHHESKVASASVD